MLEDDEVAAVLLEELEERYAFDSAKESPCGNGCGTIVRMFSGGEWWVDARNPPAQKAWWCDECLHDKCVKALEDAGIEWLI